MGRHSHHHHHLHSHRRLHLTQLPHLPILLQGLLLAIAGMIQGLMTVEVVTSYIKTPSDNSAVIASMGLANLVSGFLGGMGGDAMIGLSTINCLNGGKSRLGPTIVALGIAFFVMGVPVVLNFVPIASLSGVMIVVVLHTFKWAKIPMVLAFFVPQKFRKTINAGLCGCLPKWMHLPEEVDRWEVIIILAVTLITIFVNLVIAVGVGVVLACVRFSWVESTECEVESSTRSDGTKVYRVKGKLFFATALRFHTHFTPEADPAKVELLFENPLMDYSAADALARVKGLYEAQAKELDVKELDNPADGAPEAKPAPAPIEMVVQARVKNGGD